MNLKHLAASLLAAEIAVVPTHAEPVHFMTLDPGHFHAALVQKSMLAGVDATVDVYAPAGPDLERHLALINGFNTRAEQPTHWQTQLHQGPDYLAEMLRDKPGNVVVLAGNNSKKSRYILECVKAGLNVLSDKPMAIDPEGLKLIEQAYQIAAEKKLLLLDIMTERHEITTMLQKEFSRHPEVFGTLEKGSKDDPAVTKESVHHFCKLVNGAPLQRPPWFYDPKQQGEAIVDVTTHLTDLVQWECFPDQVIGTDAIKVLSAKSWSTAITAEQFKKSTGQETWPDYLKPLLDDKGVLQTPANGAFDYTLNGVHARVSVLWKFEAPAGAGDTHDSLLCGTKASLHIRQGADQNYKPVLYIEPREKPDEAFQVALDKTMKQINTQWPGVTLKDLGGRWEVVVPESYKNGHEAHFGQVTETYLGYLNGKPVPAWEVPNTLAKYRTLMEAWNLSR